ncbi:MAG: SDR family oxidoreductase [Saprospiraceae bacterium]
MPKRIVITGGSKGIGRALIEKFISEGYDVATCSRNAQDLNSLQDVFSTQYPEREFIAYPCDVSKADSIISWCNLIRTKWDKFDILINNAGTFFPGSVLSEAESDLLVQLDTNLLSAYRFTRALIPLIYKNGQGHIFNLCSIASQKAYPNGGAYTISKFAVYGFSKCLREELKQTAIKVTAVLPGATWSDSWKESSFTQEDMIAANDIAELIWSCSRLSKQAVVEEIIIRPQGGDL